MDWEKSFLILGLEPVKDEKLIKKAYREKLAGCNPEDDPEGFKRLRAAYEQACAYARESGTRHSDGGRDETPSGLWMERVEHVYQNIRTRRDTRCWQELFDDDIFQALEEEENCRWKFLGFLMDHFRLPSDVWKLLDTNLHLTKDASMLRESFPVDFINFVVNRCERGEDLEFGLFEGEDNASYDLFFNCYDSCWHALQEGKTDEAQRYLEEAAGLHIYHPAMEVCRGMLLMAQEKRAEAVAFMGQLFAKYPQDTMVAYNTAEIYWKCDNKAEAVEIFRKVKEENSKHYMANVRLTQWNYDQGNYKEAKKCAEEVLSLGGDDSFMELLIKINIELEKDLELRWLDEDDWEAALELGWCYLQDGKTSRGLRLTKAIEKRISREREAEYNGLVTKLLLEEAEYEDAVYRSRIWEELLEKKIAEEEPGEEREKDQGRVFQAHAIRMQGYKGLGYKDKENFSRVIAEIEAMETGGIKDIGLLIEKSQIYMEMEEYEKSLEIAEKLIREYQVYAAAANVMETCRRQWDAEGVVRSARICIEHFPNYVRAYEHLGRVYLDLKEKEKLQELLDEAARNHVESPYLEAYRYQLEHTPPSVETLNRRLKAFRKDFQDKLEDGQTVFYAHGLPVITEYLYWYPGVYMLRRRADFHKSGMQLDKALEDNEKALEDEPANPYIHQHISNIYVLKGDFEQALISIRKAILYDDGSIGSVLYYYMARIYMLLGDCEQALACFRQYDRTAEKDGGHLRNMAKCLARLGETQEAVKRLEEYYRKSDGGYYEGYWDSLTNIYFTAGDRQNYRKTLELWREKLLREKLAFWTNLWFRSSHADREKILKEHRAYHNSRGWFHLYSGDKKAAMDSFKRDILLAVRGGVKDYEESLPDIIFAAVLCGEDSLGRKYARKLSDWLARVSRQPADPFYERPKARLTAEFLAGYYTYTEEQLQELLDREKGCALCGFCLMPLCQELEGMRILLLLRQGKTQEARERLARNLKVQPYDEYMQAINGVLYMGAEKEPEKKQGKGI